MTLLIGGPNLDPEGIISFMSVLSNRFNRFERLNRFGRFCFKKTHPPA